MFVSPYHIFTFMSINVTIHTTLQFPFFHISILLISSYVCVQVELQKTPDSE